MATVGALRTLPYVWYTDPAVLRLEQQRLFARSWRYAARLDQVVEPGQLATTGHALIAEALPPRLAGAAGTDGLELLRRRLVESSDIPVKPRLGWDDFKGAIGVFLLVVSSTFPLVVPFLLLDQTGPAIRVSNLIGLAVLFIAGWMLARYAGAKPWQGAVVVAVIGAMLIIAIIALGG